MHLAAQFEKRITMENVDLYISAEIPPKEKPELRDIIMRHNVHGPCGELDPACPCMVNGECSKDYPKDPNPASFTDDKGFPHYRRRCTEKVLLRRNRKPQVLVTDRDVVPWNEYLSMKYDAHINIEQCGTTHVVAYLYKYLCKGPDRALNALVEEGAPIDEIQDYINSRYLSACEAHWRICAFNLHERSPAVKALAIHLEDANVVIFDPLNPEQALHATTELLRYLDRPLDPVFDQCTYVQYYEQFLEIKKKDATKAVIDASYAHPDGKHLIKLRTVKDLLTRIHWVPSLLSHVAHSRLQVSVAMTELYFFRLILLQRPVRSYLEARTVEGTVFETYCEAARAMGIIIDDHEYVDAIIEGSNFMTGHGTSPLPALFPPNVFESSATSTASSS